MPSRTIETRTPANLRSLAKEIADFASDLELAATMLEEFAPHQVPVTHESSLEIALKNMRGFTAAVRSAVRDLGHKNTLGTVSDSPKTGTTDGKSKPKKTTEIRRADTGENDVTPLHRAS